MTGPFQITLIHGNRHGLVFMDNFTNTTFNYATKSKDGFPSFLKQFWIDFRKLLRTWKVVELRVLRSAYATWQKYTTFVGTMVSSASYLTPNNRFKMERQRYV